ISLAAAQRMRLALLAVTATCTATPPSDGGPSAPTCPAPTIVDPASARELAIVGEPGAAAGIFDPSIIYPGPASGGALAYSAMPDEHSIRTRLAASTDHGATWVYAADLNQPEAATIATTDPNEKCPANSCSGFLISEVPSLVFDADDPDPSRRWKLFAHRYL